MNRYVANLIAIAIVTGWNFCLNSKLNWRDTGPASHARCSSPSARARPHRAEDDDQDQKRCDEPG